MAECAFCLADLADDGAEFCGPPCRASWNLLFADPAVAEPDDDVYDDESVTLPLDYNRPRRPTRRTPWTGSRNA